MSSGAVSVLGESGSRLGGGSDSCILGALCGEREIKNLEEKGYRPKQQRGKSGRSDIERNLARGVPLAPRNSESEKFLAVVAKCQPLRGAIDCPSVALGRFPLLLV